ncbi:hypothetical protein ACEZDB_38620 [Streptacidiphilus sp. N1-3]|uniref:Uncharacterized protein n=1 Tax=Streptacidiphilus alkalitolerans TaxID=3342712 RepID=A0ABV6XE68_9ACTN
MRAEPKGWVTVHGVRLPGGDLMPVWRLVTDSQVRAQAAAQLLGGTAEPDGAQRWAVVTQASALRVWIMEGSGSVLEFRLMKDPGLGVLGLDMGPWTLAEVFGAEAAARVARWSLGDLAARVVIVKDQGGGLVRHLAPALRRLASV